MVTLQFPTSFSQRYSQSQLPPTSVSPLDSFHLCFQVRRLLLTQSGTQTVFLQNLRDVLVLSKILRDHITIIMKLPRAEVNLALFKTRLWKSTSSFGTGNDLLESSQSKSISVFSSRK